MLTPADFFSWQDEIAEQIFSGCRYVWQGLPNIKRVLQEIVGDEQTINGKVMPGAYMGDQPVYMAADARVEPGAYIYGPAFIGPGVVVRHGAFVRENVILLSGSVVGHATEVKNSLLLPGAHAPHFNYVGDSILGHGVNLGAGTKLSNLGMLSEKDKVTGKRPSIKLVIDSIEYDTGLAKLGAILGDGAQTGCNAVLNPGCLVGPGTLVYANTSLRKGYHAAGSIVKLRQNIRRIDRQM